MPEGVAAPFLVGAVCCLTLFWHSGERVWIAAAGVALALAVASEYPAVPYGARCVRSRSSPESSGAPRRVSGRRRGAAARSRGWDCCSLVPAGLRRAPLDRGQRRDHGRSARLHVRRRTDTGRFQRAADPAGAVAYVTGDVVGGAGARRRARLPLPDPARDSCCWCGSSTGACGGSTRCRVLAAGPQRAAGHGRTAGHPRLPHGLPAVSRLPAVRRRGLGAVRDRDQPAAPRCGRADPRRLAGSRSRRRSGS